MQEQNNIQYCRATVSDKELVIRFGGSDEDGIASPGICLDEKHSCNLHSSSEEDFRGWACRLFHTHRMQSDPAQTNQFCRQLRDYIEATETILLVLPAKFKDFLSLTDRNQQYISRSELTQLNDLLRKSPLCHCLKDLSIRVWPKLSLKTAGGDKPVSLAELYTVLDKFDNSEDLLEALPLAISSCFEKGLPDARSRAGTTGGITTMNHFEWRRGHSRLTKSELIESTPRSLLNRTRSERSDGSSCGYQPSNTG